MPSWSGSEGGRNRKMDDEQFEILIAILTQLVDKVQSLTLAVNEMYAEMQEDESQEEWRGWVQ